MSDQWDTPPGHFGSETDEWATPPQLLRALDAAVGGFDLDPCSGAEERSIAAEAYTVEDDGLMQAWHGRVWCNPPYSAMEDWMAKAVAERERTDSILVLAPARTSTQWFHNHATKADVLAFLEGRLTFGTDRLANAPFPSLIAVFGECPDPLRETLDRRGAVYGADQLAARTTQTEIPT